VFNAVDDLAEILILADMPMSQTQAMNLAIVFFARNQSSYNVWNCYPAKNRTWLIYIHFL